MAKKKEETKEIAPEVAVHPKEETKEIAPEVEKTDMNANQIVSFLSNGSFRSLGNGRIHKMTYQNAVILVNKKFGDIV